MASLSFNSTRIKNPITNFTSPSKTLISHFSKNIKTPPHIKNLRKNLYFQPCLSVSESSVFSTPLQPDKTGEAVSEEEEEDNDPTSELSYFDPETDPESVTEWEVDFCSRPILDIRGKKIWELVVCDESLSLQYTKYFPNNVINSVTLKNAIVSICEELGVPLPEKIRFFRSQMQTIITRACNDLNIKPIPSKRIPDGICLEKASYPFYILEVAFIQEFYAPSCLSLVLWLEERYESVYTRHPGFQKGSKPLLSLDNPFPVELPENLYGDKWAFVQLPFSAVQEEVSSLETRFAFGASLDLDLLGIEVNDDTLIPGLAVSSSRAKPLAAWMNGLEVCSIEADTSRANIVLSVGIATRYIYATYKKTPVTTSEAEAWEAAKKACGGLHFLAIQDDLDSDDCVGFWLLLDLPPPPV
ncbi:hypothetical protein PHJA_000920600 [Phtheirospermum japonicum]|uniref:Uncharacterized protein n=1 Tax=Phtheirospermum japonicum TaxID=374723 RepID=A0A830BPV9_9LAMI|nr:hypothetical protein PHJA_000920600 [Phtheirospermum japonicum]